MNPISLKTKPSFIQIIDYLSRYSRQISLYFSAIAGFSLSFAFAPYHYYALAVLSPALFLATLLHAKPAHAFWRGFVFGLFFFGSSVYWIFISIHHYSHVHLLLAFLITTLFIAFLSLFPALQAYFLARFFVKPNANKCLIGFPCSWALIEALRSMIFTGFPWVLLVYSQTDGFLGGFIPIVGDYGVAFITCFCSGLLVCCWQSTKRKDRYISLIALIALAFLANQLQQINWTKESTQTVSVALVQANVPQEIKWSKENRQEILGIYQTLSKAYWGKDIIVWPEGSIPLLLNKEAPLLADYNQLAKQSGSTLLIGLSMYQEDPGRYYNALISLGMGSGVYYKRHLVPFGEFLPFSTVIKDMIKRLHIPMSAYTPGPESQANLMAGKLRIAPFICYEIAFATEVRKQLQHADLIVAVSDDSWFGHSIAAAQHLQIASTRALETGRDMLFATNTGITAVINGKGKVTKQLPSFTRAVLSADVHPREGLTPWMQYGDTPILTLLLIVLVAAAYFRMSVPKKKEE